MVLDPIPQSLPVHFCGSRPQPPTSLCVWWLGVSKSDLWNSLNFEFLFKGALFIHDSGALCACIYIHTWTYFVIFLQGALFLHDRGNLRVPTCVLHLYVYVYIHVYIHIYMYIHTHMYTYIYMYLNIYKRVWYIYTYIYTCIYIYLNIYKRVCSRARPPWYAMG